MRRTLPNLMKVIAPPASVILAACQATASPKPAVLETIDDTAIAQLESTIAAAMGKANVEFGAMDLANSSEIPILPPRPDMLEGHSPALPTYFDLAIENGTCLVIERSSGEAFQTEGVRCKLASD